MEQPETGRGSGGHGGDQVRLKHPRAIIISGGTHPSFLPAMAINEQPWEVWTLNAIRPQWLEDNAIGIDRHFNLHRYGHLQRDWANGVDAEIKWAQENPHIPFYTLDDWAGQIPGRQQFPRHMGFPRDDYHASSFDLMLAFALHLGMTELHVSAFQMNVPMAEPISARACMEYWIGYATARGMTVHTDWTSDLMCQYQLVRNHLIYGWDDVDIVIRWPDDYHPQWIKGERRKNALNPDYRSHERRRTA